MSPPHSTGSSQAVAVWWLNLPAGPMLCVAEDGSGAAADQLNQAHNEMAWALDGIVPEVMDSSKENERDRQICEALEGTAFEGWHFCVADTGRSGPFRHLSACGLGNTKKARTRTAKAALAVAAQLRKGFSGTPCLDTLLPLARRCAQQGMPQRRAVGDAWDS